MQMWPRHKALTMYYYDPIKLFTLLVMELGCIDLNTWPAPLMRSGPRVHQIVDMHYRPCKIRVFTPRQTHDEDACVGAFSVS